MLTRRPTASSARSHRLVLRTHRHRLGIAQRGLREASGRCRPPAHRNCTSTSLGRLQIQLDAITSARGGRRLEATTTASPIPLIDAGPSARTTWLCPRLRPISRGLCRACLSYRRRGGFVQSLLFERLLRDVHGATQHVGVHGGHFTDLGARIVDDGGGMKLTFTPTTTRRTILPRLRRSAAGRTQHLSRARSYLEAWIGHGGDGRGQGNAEAPARRHGRLRDR